jgi:predicted transcriptional regulator
MGNDVLLEVVRRRSVLTTLQENALTPSDLTDRLDLSRSTVHRIARQLEAENLLARPNGDLELTALGDVVADELRAFEETFATAQRLEPALAAFHETRFTFPVDAFADATTTESTTQDPYRPVNRFMSLVAGTDTLRGVDPASINPLHLDDLHQAIVDGMETDAVFRPSVVQELIRNNPERARTAFESGNLMLRTHEDLQFGLTLCDDRVGVGIYDEETGLLTMYLDTDSPAAYDWAEGVYATFLVESDVVDWRAELPPD